MIIAAILAVLAIVAYLRTVIRGADGSQDVAPRREQESESDIYGGDKHRGDGYGGTYTLDDGA